MKTLIECAAVNSFCHIFFGVVMRYDWPYIGGCLFGTWMLVLTIYLFHDIKTEE